MSKISNNLASEVRRSRGKFLVLFLDGTSGMRDVFLYGGAAFIGDPTAYAFRGDGSVAWVKPGESVSYVETVLKGN